MRDGGRIALPPEQDEELPFGGALPFHQLFTWVPFNPLGRWTIGSV
jgi:hypothetical protein